VSRIFIFVNGILNCPGDHDGWTDRAATWVNVRTKDRAEKFEYFCGPLTRRLRLNSHAQDLAHLVAQYHDHRVVLVGHSNGCELICRALRVSGVRIEDVHLISGACSPDFNRNGLAEVMESGRVQRVVVYVAGKDLPMRLAKWTGKLLGLFGLGYGTLGHRGPLNHPAGVRVVIEPGYGHSTWFEDNVNFNKLMVNVARR
jgi:pimeloyl-ACP methyl ester carboxylesterase